MILRTRQTEDALIFCLEGHLDFTTTQQFEETCADLMHKHSCEKIIFNMEKLRFVGSTSINHFLRVLKEFNSLQTKPIYCHVSSEFQKLFQAFETKKSPFFMVENENAAVEAVKNPETLLLKNPKGKAGKSAGKQRKAGRA